MLTGFWMICPIRPQAGKNWRPARPTRIPALIERLKEPGSAIAPGRDDIVAGMVAAITNWQLGHGEPEEICKACQPSLAAVLGAWWDKHFTRGEAASEVTSQPP